jgi:opacity protein-like surface antigen
MNQYWLVLFMTFATILLATCTARPDQQFGDSTLIGPEAQLQYHWRLGRFRPYAGGGVGFAYVKSDFIGSDTDLTLSAAGGVRFDLNSRTAVLGEMRLRGFEREFAGSTAEWVGGLSWRLGE